MLKEYTLKVTVETHGFTEDQVDDYMNSVVDHDISPHVQHCEITHEEVVEPEVDPWMSQIELDKFPPSEPEVERET